MKTWKQFLESQVDPKVDFSQIQTLYSKANIAVELVRMYKPDLLNNIATIANLTSGAYGVYNSGENYKILPQTLEQQLIYYGKVNKRNIGNIPQKTIIQYYPSINPNQIKQNDTIRVNVRRILREKKSDLEAILEIASTIVHESIHEIERETTGKTNENGPRIAEADFLNWVKRAWPTITSRFPDLSGHSSHVNAFANKKLVNPSACPSKRC